MNSTDAKVSQVSPCKRSRLGLDGLNFLMADVRDGVGPFLSVYLKGGQHWPAGQIGIAMAASSIAAALCQILAGLLLVALASAGIIAAQLVMVGVAAAVGWAGNAAAPAPLKKFCHP